MSNPWPERRSIPYGFGHKDYEDDADYTVFLLQQLFVELEKINAKLDHPLYQITMPPIDGAKSGLMPNPPVGNTFDPFEKKP